MSDSFNQHYDRRDDCRDDSWLSMLVDTMNAVSEPQAARRMCDSGVIDALKAKLERPASANRQIARRSDFMTTF